MATKKLTIAPFGFVSVQVVDTDKSFAASNLGYALLQGSAAAGLPSITGINGHGLAATSLEPGPPACRRACG